MRGIHAVLLPACILAACAAAGTINLATGLNGSGTLQTTEGATDANWVTSPTGSAGQVVAPGGADWYGGWPGNGPNSSWITRNHTTSANGNPLITYTRMFDLSGFNLASVVVSGSWTIDDAGDLVINGHNIGTLATGSWTTLHSFTVPNADLLPGMNTLQMVTTSSDNYLEGARLEGTATGAAGAATPEPSTIVLAGLGILGLIVRRIRK